MTAPQPTPRWILYYDSGCMLCRTLAALVQGDEISTLPLPEDAGDIALETPNGNRLHGIDAWMALQGLHPALQGWAWLARKLGMDDHRAASAMQRTAHRMRSLCRKCKPVLPLGNHPTKSNSWTQEGES